MMSRSDRHDPTSNRLFLAVDLTDATRTALRARLGPLALPGRVVASQNWHLTLAFLGDTPREAQLRLHARLAERDLGHRFTITFDGLGAFPRPARATVLWVGLSSGAEPLSALHTRLCEAVRAAGLPTDARPFSAHLTLSRIRPPADVRALVAAANQLDLPMSVAAVTLFRSHLRDMPTRYEPVSHYPLTEG